MVSGNGNLKPWKPGQTGNPNGRPKGTSLTLTLRKLLDTPVPGKDITYAEAVIRRLVAEAMKGNTKAANIILERIDGKVPQAITGMVSEGNPDGAIMFNVTIPEARERVV